MNDTFEDIQKKELKRLASERDELVGAAMALLTVIGEMESIARRRYEELGHGGQDDEEASVMMPMGLRHDAMLITSQALLAEKHMHVIKRLVVDEAEKMGLPDELADKAHKAALAASGMKAFEEDIGLEKAKELAKLASRTGINELSDRMMKFLKGGEA